MPRERHAGEDIVKVVLKGKEDKLSLITALYVYSVTSQR